MKTADDVLEMSLDTLFATFFNVEMDESNFAVVSNYKATKYLPYMPSNSHDETATALTQKYGLNFKKISNTKIISEISNPKKYNLDEYRHMLYETILGRIVNLDITYNIDKEIALAMFIFRGSADFNRGLYAVDIKFPSQQYLDDMYKLLLSTNDLIDRLNLNFRELQSQFQHGIQRNTQIRINLKWFYVYSLSHFPNINKYKYETLQRNQNIIGEIRKFNAFTDRLAIYRENILGRSLTDKEILNLRNEMNFETSNLSGQRNIPTRNQKIVSFAREAFPDECVGCKNHYDIKDRSFIMPRNGRYYFEVNHVIPYANDNDRVDVLDNLVKLCPTCHRALTPGRADEKLQREIIHNMLESRQEVKQFVIMMNSNSLATPEDFVFDSLK